MSYGGYLSPHVERIKSLAVQGNGPVAIAETLIADGVRSPWDHQYGMYRVAPMAAMVRYVLRGGPAPKKPKWQVWTPEAQEAEFQREYANS